MTIFETRSHKSRTLGVDLRNRVLREIEPDAFLRFGNRLIPIFAQSENGRATAETLTLTNRIPKPPPIL